MSIFTNSIITNAYMSMYRIPIRESYTYINESAIDKNIHRADELADNIAKENFVYNSPVKDANGNIQKYARSGNDMKYNAVYIKHLVGEKIPFSKDQKSKAKFFLGATRIFGEILKNSHSENDINNQCSEFDKILGIISNDSNHINEYDNNLNGLTLDKLQEKFGQKVKDLSAKEKEEINSKEYTRNKRYTITPCNTWEDITKFGKPLTTWCVAQKNGEYAYDSYTNNGICKFYVCTRDGYENLKPIPGDNPPLDEYGLSMIAICVNADGSLKTCTCRWNHDNGGDDNIMSTKQISDLLGVNFFETFKPREPKDIFNNLGYDRYDPLCSHFKFRYDKEHNYYKFEDNKLIKYKCCYRKSNLVCLANTHLEWYDLTTGKKTEPPHVIDGSIDCYGCNTLTSLEGSPRYVDGSFNCSKCSNLISLRGAPSAIEKDFYCNYCDGLTSLEGAPSKIGGTFDCTRCTNLNSLEGAPSEVGKEFNCSYCKNITSLEGAPNKVGESFLCAFCSNLTSLKGSPSEVGRDFSCLHCDNLISLEGAPSKVGKGFTCAICKKLKSLKGAPSEVGGDFLCSSCISIKSLVGSPKNIRRDFSCNDCINLVSLKGAPEIIKGQFNFNNCKIKSLRGFPKEVYGWVSCTGIDDSLAEILRKKFRNITSW